MGLSLKTIKGLFWAKIVKKIEFSGKKLTNFQKKKNLHFRPKKQAGAELKNKKRSFWAKILINIEFKGQKLTYSQKKK